MKSLLRTLAPAVAVLAALGAAAPAAAAKPAHDKAVHAKVKLDKPVKIDKAGKARAAKVKVDKAAHKLAAARQRLARAAERKAVAVERSVAESRVAGLDEATAAALSANATVDAAALRLLAAESLAADGTTIGGVTDQVATYRGEFYVVLVNRLRYAAALRAAAAGDATVTDAIDAFVAPALGLHADAGKSRLQDLQKQLSAIAETLEPETGDVTDGATPPAA